ncbi:MAG: hypothetical protein P8188_02650 [Gemmatimonadota bacterium]
MRWLVQWLLAGVTGSLAPRADGLSRLRRGLTRTRLRRDYHVRRLQEAEDSFARAARRVEFLEMSEEAEVAELVEARKALLEARHAVQHHERRREQVEELRGRMESDRERLLDGRDPEYQDLYDQELGP